MRRAERGDHISADDLEVCVVKHTELIVVVSRQSNRWGVPDAPPLSIP
jgi:hypothetical protein